MLRANILLIWDQKVHLSLNLMNVIHSNVDIEIKTNMSRGIIGNHIKT